MAEKKQPDSELRPLADIDPLIHAPARLRVLTYLYVVDSIDFVYLKRVTGLSWGNLSTHITGKIVPFWALFFFLFDLADLLLSAVAKRNNRRCG